MATRQHGITANTPQNLIVDAGEVRMNYVSAASPGTRIGATRGGNTFTIEQELRDMRFDGAKGPVKGGRRYTNIVPKITANFVEFSLDLFNLALPGSTNTTASGYDEVTRALEVALSEYATNIVLIGQVSGSSNAVICGINNALATGNLEMSLTDNEESVLSVEFTGHFGTDDLDAEPWFIRYPDDVTTP